jgi:dihydroneopterin aldolase
MSDDCIVLEGMQFYGYHGALPAERELGQPFSIDLKLYCDLQPAGLSDDLSKTVDYSRVFTVVEEIVTGKPFQLIESLAEQIAAVILKEFPVTRVLVRVRKPHAPLNGIFADLAVEITRGEP